MEDSDTGWAYISPLLGVEVQSYQINTQPGQTGDYYVLAISNNDQYNASQPEEQKLTLEVPALEPPQNFRGIVQSDYSIRLLWEPLANNNTWYSGYFLEKKVITDTSTIEWEELTRITTSITAYDLNGKEIKKFGGGGDHFGNFVEAVKSRDASSLTSDAFQGHLSAALAHLANICYYIGEEDKVSVSEAKAILKKVKSRDDNMETLDRTLKHWKENGVDLDKYPMSMGPMLKFDPVKEVFTNSPAANRMLHREYRKPFVCPTADKV